MSSYSDNHAFFLADEYFRHQMDNILIVDERGAEKFLEADSHGKCYHFSTWALLGLQKDDLRLVGTIDTFPNEGYNRSKDYKHAWVEFRTTETYGNAWFVYDPLYSMIVPRDVWYEACKPREIISRLTQQEVVKKYMDPKYAYTIREGMSCVFKNTDDVPEESNNKKNGYLFNALSEGYLFGRLGSEKYFFTSYFIAHRY